MTLLIRDEDVREVVTPEDVIEAVEDVYRQHGLGRAQDTPRREVRMKGKDLPHLAAGTTSVGQGLSYLEEQNRVVISHAFHLRGEGITAKTLPSIRIPPDLIHVIDPDEGRTLAIIQSPYASWMRTSGRRSWRQIPRPKELHCRRYRWDRLARQRAALLSDKGQRHHQGVRPFWPKKGCRLCAGDGE